MNACKTAQRSRRTICVLSEIIRVRKRHLLNECMHILLTLWNISNGCFAARRVRRTVCMQTAIVLCWCVFMSSGNRFRIQIRTAICALVFLRAFTFTNAANDRLVCFQAAKHCVYCCVICFTFSTRCFVRSLFTDFVCVDVCSVSQCVLLWHSLCTHLLLYFLLLLQIHFSLKSVFLERNATKLVSLVLYSQLSCYALRVCMHTSACI